MSEPKRYGVNIVDWRVMPGSTAADIAKGPTLDIEAELARDLLAAQARVKELERELDNERMTGGPCAVCAGSGMLLTDEECRVCAGSGSAHQESHGLRVLAQTGERRIAELEATIARVSDLCQALFIETDDMMADVSKHAKASALIEVRMRIESALATPGKT